MSHDDALSLSMFWAGALMVFTPLITAAVVIAVVWRQRKKETRGRAASPTRVPAQRAGALTIRGEPTHAEEARGQ